MYTQQNRAKLALLICSAIMCLIILIANFTIPKGNWKRIFDVNNSATAFQGNNSGAWNSPKTWGMQSGSLNISRIHWK